uniref:Uncharacterized protein n=1 Tax=Phyllymenia taiwanensis TaxID=1260292 RepID=R9XYE9_9FLOR|nr:hypothetical protein [Grateloupia taiwanensis]AGO19805.1 hypothetical protein [Grateloupia taiwanensis]
MQDSLPFLYILFFCIALKACLWKFNKVYKMIYIAYTLYVIFKFQASIVFCNSNK